MQEQNIKSLVTQGLPALKAGGRIAAEAVDKIQDDATSPDLKAALKKGEQTAKMWHERIERAMQEAGASGEDDNPIVRAIGETAKKIRDEAPDSQSRDLGIIASGQLALHYWIGAFGTVASYAKRSGLSQTAEQMATCVDEAKEQDEAHTRLAYQIMGADA